MRLRGSICALVTPFNGAGDIDFPAWARVLDLHLAAATDGVVVGGSTGESGSLEEHELGELIAAAVAQVQGRMHVVAGCGASSTQRTLRLLKIAASAGADGALVVTPAYVRPTQPGLAAHFRAVADADLLPVVLYNVPSRTGCDLLPGTVAELAGHPGIVGVKEARNDSERMQQLLSLQSKDFAVLSGDDPTALRALRAGADGVISVVANVCPGAFAQLCGAATGEAASADAIDAELAAINDFLGCESNPIPVKWLLHRMQLMGSALRLPLLPLSSEWRASADRLLPHIERLENGAGGTAALSLL